MHKSWDLTSKSLREDLEQWGYSIRRVKPTPQDSYKFGPNKTVNKLTLNVWNIFLFLTSCTVLKHELCIWQYCALISNGWFAYKDIEKVPSLTGFPHWGKQNITGQKKSKSVSFPHLTVPLNSWHRKCWLLCASHLFFTDCKVESTWSLKLSFHSVFQWGQECTLRIVPGECFRGMDWGREITEQSVATRNNQDPGHTRGREEEPGLEVGYLAHSP